MTTSLRQTTLVLVPSTPAAIRRCRGCDLPTRERYCARCTDELEALRADAARVSWLARAVAWLLEAVAGEGLAEWTT